MRGRQPRSPYLKALAGQVTGVQPVSIHPAGEPPAHFSAVRKAIWWETLQCAPAGLITRADRGVLELYVVTYDRWRQAVVLCDKKGPITQDVRHKHTARLAPWARLERALCTQVAELAGRLGLTPISRSGIYIPPPREARTEFEKLLDSYPGGPDYVPYPGSPDYVPPKNGA